MKGQHFAEFAPGGAGTEARAPLAAGTKSGAGGNPVHQRSMGHTARALLSAQGITWTTTYIGIQFIPRLLGASNLGLFYVALTVGGFVMVLAGFGTANHIVKEIARDPSKTANIVAHAVILRLLLCAAIALPVVAVAGFAGLGKTGMFVLAAVMMGTFVALLNEVATSALQGAHRTGRSQLSVAVITFGGQIVAVGLLFAAANVAGYAWVVSTAAPLVSLLVLGLLLRQVLRGRVQLRISSARALLGAGVPFLAWNLALYSYASASPILLAALAGRVDAGLFAFAFRIAAIPVFVATVVVATIFATLAESAKTDPPYFRRLLTQAARTTIVAIFPASIGMALVGPQLAGFLGGDEFKLAAPAIAILALQAPSMGLGTVIGTGLIALDRQRPWALMGWIAAISNLGLTALGVVMAPHFGVSEVAGAATANLVIDVGLMVAAWVLIGGHMDRRAVLQVALRTAMACALMAAVVLLLLDVNVIVAVVAGAGTYALACLATRTVTPGDIRRLALRPA